MSSDDLKNASSETMSVEGDGERFEPAFERGVAGLLPVIAQDFRSRDVLMMAWMNEEAYRETLTTGYVTYFSRSKNRLWRKGEESGHRQRVHAVYLDCDRDTILLRVEQSGAACHEGYPNCFFRQVVDDRAVLVQERIVDPQKVYGSKAAEDR